MGPGVIVPPCPLSVALRLNKDTLCFAVCRNRFTLRLTVVGDFLFNEAFIYNNLRKCDSRKLQLCCKFFGTNGTNMETLQKKKKISIKPNLFVE